jgi:hypothetical protein
MHNNLKGQMGDYRVFNLCVCVHIKVVFEMIFCFNFLDSFCMM